MQVSLERAALTTCLLSFFKKNVPLIKDIALISHWSISYSLASESGRIRGITPFLFKPEIAEAPYNATFDQSGRVNIIYFALFILHPRTPLKVASIIDMSLSETLYFSRHYSAALRRGYVEDRARLQSEIKDLDAQLESAWVEALRKLDQYKELKRQELELDTSLSELGRNELWESLDRQR